MDIKFVLIVLGILVLLATITLILYRFVYEKRINEVLVSREPKRVLSPMKLFLVSIVILGISLLMLWGVIFPDYNKMDIDSQFSKSTISLIQREYIEMYDVDHSDPYFTQGDYIDIDLNEEFQVLDNQFNSVSFEIDGVHNRLQYVIYGSDNKVWIPTRSKSYDWSLDETPYRVLRYLTIIQLIDSVDIENTFLLLGTLDENEWYNFHIESNFINDYSIIENYIEEGLEMYIIDEYGEQTPMNETNFQEDRVYIAMEFNLFGPTDASNSSFTVTDSITYYFDITDYLIQ